MAQCDGKILMIDDEQDLLKLSSSILRREGFAVETRSDAREALALLRENPLTSSCSTCTCPR